MDNYKEISKRLIVTDDSGLPKPPSMKLWGNLRDNVYFPIPNAEACLPAGYYGFLFYDGRMQFEKITVDTNKIYDLPNSTGDLIKKDLTKFWQSEDRYRRYGRVFRRNYLIYSAPGTGKTSLIYLMCEQLLNEYSGIVLFASGINEIEYLPNALRILRDVESDRRVIVVIEDIDRFVGCDDDKTPLLDFLDGNSRCGGVVTIATTNHIERMEERFVNRPSRFDRVLEFPLPDAVCRRLFFEKSVLPDDLASIDLDEWVKKTEGYTLDHLNELVLLVFVFGHSEEEAFATLNKMIGDAGWLKNKTSVKPVKKIGF